MAVYLRDAHAPLELLTGTIHGPNGQHIALEHGLAPVLHGKHSPCELTAVEFASLLLEWGLPWAQTALAAEREIAAMEAAGE